MNGLAIWSLMVLRSLRVVLYPFAATKLHKVVQDSI